jgi:hypothetical protein
MPAPDAKKPASGARSKKRRRTAVRAKSLVVGYAYSGDVLNLPGVVKRHPGQFRAVLVPQSADAEASLKESDGFERVALDETAARVLQTKKARPVPIEPDAFEPDARARAILRGRQFAHKDLAAAGGAFDLTQVRALLNDVSRQAVEKRVNSGSLLVVPGPSGRPRFPALQFDRDGRLVKGLKEVQAALGFSSPWAVLNFLVNGNDHLAGCQPIEVLRRGEIDTVVAAAHSVGVQGA